jgi:hypothetical protein
MDFRFPRSLHPRRQRGMTTMAITLLLLLILTLLVLFSTNVAFFEQRTANNQYRADLAQNASEYALSVASEWMKVNRRLIVSEDSGGWLAGGSDQRWVQCADVSSMSATHPCMAETDANRRDLMYFWSADGTTSGSTSVTYTTGMTGADLTAVGGTSNSAFATTTTVQALLCRLDFTDVDNPVCALDPEDDANKFAVVLLANAAMSSENASQWVRVTLATYSTIGNNANVPLVASGLVEGLGSAAIVTSPDAGGPGLYASVWAFCDVNFDASAGVDPDGAGTGCSGAPGNGVGSIDTCHLGDYLGDTDEDELLSTCATVNNACGCDHVDDSEKLSTGAPDKVEGLDILDRDNSLTSPDIQYFPRDPLDDATDSLDDSLFEFVFNQEVVTEGADTVAQTCGAGTENCASYALQNDMDATVLTNCDSLDANSSGLYYVTGSCNIPSQVGSATSPVIVVVDDDVNVNGNTLFYGILFVRSDDNSAEVTGNGGVQIFGAMIVEGNVDLAGSIELVYSDVIMDRLRNSDEFLRFGKVPGSWLDNATAF